MPQPAGSEPQLNKLRDSLPHQSPARPSAGGRDPARNGFPRCEHGRVVCTCRGWEPEDFNRLSILGLTFRRGGHLRPIAV